MLIKQPIYWGFLTGCFVFIVSIAANCPADTATYYHVDVKGSIRFLSDAQALIIQAYHYDAYGEATSTIPANDTNPYKMNGSYNVREEGLSEHTIYQMKHRYYSAKLKRFLSKDPAGMDGGHNLYAFADANPVHFMDPFGLCSECTGFSSSLDNPITSHPLFSMLEEDYNTAVLISSTMNWLLSEPAMMLAQNNDRMSDAKTPLIASQDSGTWFWRDIDPRRGIRKKMPGFYIDDEIVPYREGQTMGYNSDSAIYEARFDGYTYAEILEILQNERGNSSPIHKISNGIGKVLEGGAKITRGIIEFPVSTAGTFVDNTGQVLQRTRLDSVKQQKETFLNVASFALDSAFTWAKFDFSYFHGDKDRSQSLPAYLRNKDVVARLSEVLHPGKVYEGWGLDESGTLYRAQNYPYTTGSVIQRRKDFPDAYIPSPLQYQRFENLKRHLKSDKDIDSFIKKHGAISY